MNKSRQRSKKLRKKGFALVETIIALLILAIALLAMAFVPIMSTKLALQTVQREQALFLAYDRLDQLEAVSADIVSSDNVGIYTVTWDRSKARGNAVVQVSWGGITKPSSLDVTRDMSEESYMTAVEYKE